MEHLNHVVSSVPSPRDPAQPQQWVSSQVLLCRKCSHHQTTKIKQLAAFTPREEVSTHGWVEPNCWLAVHLLPPHIPGCVASFVVGAELAITDLVTSGRTSWKPEPARPEGFVFEKRELEALGSNCSLGGQPPGLIH